MYAISGYAPIRSMDLGSHAFCIHLSPLFKEAVAKSGLDQELIDMQIKDNGERWLDCCGYSSKYDPDNCGFDADPKLPPGPRAVRSYPYNSIRVQWGEWGPNHISVPGNACGLDIGGFGCWFRGGTVLCPHNIDCWKQKQLLTIVFTEIAASVILMGAKW